MISCPAWFQVLPRMFHSTSLTVVPSVALPPMVNRARTTEIRVKTRIVPLLTSDGQEAKMVTRPRRCERRASPPRQVPSNQPDPSWTLRRRLGTDGDLRHAGLARMLPVPDWSIHPDLRRRTGIRPPPAALAV